MTADPIAANLAHHVPARRMDCWTETATERPWLFQDRYRILRDRPDPVDGARECQAWNRHPDDLKTINGKACTGCARLPEHLK